MRPGSLALIPLAAAILFAQARTTTTTTTKTTWNGTLVDASCQNTEHRETTQINPDRSTTTRTETTRTENVECPVSASTSSFGLMTADGRFIRFDNPSNARVVEFVKSNKSFSSGAPLRVNIVGTSRGDLAVVESLNAEGPAAAASPGPSEFIFDARYHDDDGRLVINSRGVSFQDIKEAKHSHTWSYEQIKEMKREGSEIKIEPISGGDFEFHVLGPGMSDDAYRMIADRIAAAKSR
jgi:hypothetical protein